MIKGYTIVMSLLLGYGFLHAAVTRRSLTPDEKKTINSTYHKQLSDLSKKYSFTITSAGTGYFFLNNQHLLRGYRYDPPLLSVGPSIDKKKVLDDYVNSAVFNYKIHLMPRPTDVIPTIDVLFNALQNDQELQSLIDQVKVMSDITQLRSEELVFPVIVIYPASTKASAQEALNKLYELFKNSVGNGLEPRFNEKITSFVFVAQGDGDHKKLPANAEFYEPDKVYFKPNVLNPAVNVDYHLVNPVYYEIKKGLQSLSQDLQSLARRFY